MGGFPAKKNHPYAILTINLTSLKKSGILWCMSTQEIIDELTKLKPDELKLVKQKLAELEATGSYAPKTGWGAALAEIVGTAEDLPADLSINHDHYLYGTPKRQ